MKAALMVAAGWMLSGAVLQGAEGEFNDIVRAISDELHARPLHIPFFGLLSLATFAAHPAGVKHIDLAVFENPDVADSTAGDVGEAIRRSARRSWRPFLRVRSWNHEHQETVLVYIADDGLNYRLLVTTLEPGEATVVEVKLDPERLSELCRDRRLGGLLPVSQTSGR
jgi:hypothetical protein